MLRFIILWLTSPMVFASILTIGATSTTTNSGLMDYLVSHYQQETGQAVKVITGGTGFILKQLAHQDIQLAITHQLQLEQDLLVKYPQGKRTPFMYNHFMIVGPKDDPAQVSKATSFKQALNQIYNSKSLFISRGDNSGTHLFELDIWKALNLNPQQQNCNFYIQAGQDMGPTLNMASELKAYTIVDEGTWLAYATRSQLTPIYHNAKEGRNIYSVIQLKNNADLSPQAAQFITWLLQDKTLALINDYKINHQQGFYTLL
jgi:tungstate transport system substrate-binding protein